MRKGRRVIMLVENYRWKHDPTCRGLLTGGRVSPEKSGTAGGASGAVAGRRMWRKVVGSGATKIHERGGGLQSDQWPVGKRADCGRGRVYYCASQSINLSIHIRSKPLNNKVCDAPC